MQIYFFYRHWAVASIGSTIYFLINGGTLNAIISIIITYVLISKYCDGGNNVYYPDLSGKIIVITGANSGIGY